MTSVYQIANWSSHFENHKSRVVESCRYVLMPNKQDGLGLQRILAEADGAAIFGIWCLILQACSRQKGRNGWLTDDGTENGRPWNFEDLSFRWRRPLPEIERCLEVITNPKVAWIHVLEQNCPSDGASRHQEDIKRRPTVNEGREGIDREKGGRDPALSLNGEGKEKVQDLLRFLKLAHEPEPAAEWVSYLIDHDITTLPAAEKHLRVLIGRAKERNMELFFARHADGEYRKVAT